MQVHFRVDGGFAVFPGLSRPFCVDVDALPPDEAGRWRSLVERCRFFERPEPVSGTRCADGRSYSITVDEGAKTRTLTFPDTLDDPDLCTLVQWLNERRRMARPR